MLHRLTILLFAAFCLMPTAYCDWPQFRGPTGQGVADVKSAPTKWSATENVAWKQSLPGQGWSSPVLSAGKIYLTAAVEDAGQISLRAICLNPADGAIAWNVEVFKPRADDLRAIHKKNSLASPTPIVDNGKLYVHFGHMGTAALDLSGKILWQQTDLKYRPLHGNGGSPILSSGLLIFSCDALADPFIVALNTTDGKIKWRTPRKTSARAQFSFSTPLEITVNQQKQIISPASGMVASYEPLTGREIWRVNYGQGYSVVPRPVYAHGLLYIATGFDKANLIAIRPEGAKGDSTDKAIVWKTARNAPLTPSVLVVGDDLYMVSDNGFATCADAKSGTVHWSQRLDGNFSASPVYAAGHVYFQSEQGVGYVMKATRNSQLISENNLDQRTLASYAVAEGALYIRSADALYRIGKQ